MSWLVGAAVLAGLVAGFDLLTRESLGVLTEGPPLGSAPFLLRSGCLAAAAAVWTVGVRRLTSGAAAARPDATGRPAVRVVSRPTPLAAPLLTAVAGSVVLALVLWWPARFTSVAAEDGPVEALTAVLLFAAAALLAVRATTVDRRGSGGAAVLLALLAVGYLVLGMEEISWGQRLIGFGTPSFLAGNTQGEANLHNLATNVLELLFFVGTTTAFVILPALQHRSRLLDRWPAVAALVPSLPLLLAFAPAAAMNYDMWNIAPVQFTFWITCATLVLLAGSAPPGTDHRLRTSAAGVLALVIALQVALLALGGRTARLWDATEYRELFTVAAMAWYAVSLRAAAGRTARPDVTPVGNGVRRVSGRGARDT